MPDGPLPEATDGDVDAFVAATITAFDEAFARSAEPIVRNAAVAGRTIQVRYAAPTLAARFGPALAHLDSTGGDRGDLAICCWDRSLSDVRPPPPPWSPADHLPYGRIRGLVDGRVRATYDATSRVLCLYDADRRVAVVHVAEAGSVPHWMDRAPFRTILTWWAADHGLALLHAAAVAGIPGAVLLAGTSGAGKSTTALHCLRAGLDFLGDDACLVACEPDPVVHSVYRFAKVDAPVRGSLGGFDRALPWITGETVIDPGNRQRAHAPLRAILLPQVGGGATSHTVAVSPSEALRVLGPTTLVEGGAPSGDALHAVVGLARRVPAYRLRLGTDPAGVVRAVESVLEDAP